MVSRCTRERRRARLTRNARAANVPAGAGQKVSWGNLGDRKRLGMDRSRKMPFTATRAVAAGLAGSKKQAAFQAAGPAESESAGKIACPTSRAFSWVSRAERGEVRDRK